MTNVDSRFDAGESIRRHSKSFALAARLLAPAPRRRAEALYGWCRRADDAVDHAPDRATAAANLAGLRAELTAVYAGAVPTDPTVRAFAGVVRECHIPEADPADLLAGFGMDVAGADYRTAADLLLYCYRAAGVVGRMMCPALGAADPRALRPAADLGIAMQLTNIARDVAEDWHRGRRYLPADWFARVPAPGDPLDDAAFAPAVRRTLDAAAGYYASGLAGLPYLDRRSRFAVRVAARVYADIGRRVAATGCRVTAGRAVVPAARKLWLVGLAAARG